LPSEDEEEINLIRIASNKSRSAVVRLLKAGPANLGTIARKTGLSRQLTAHHLNVLTNSGIIEQRAVGSVKLYALTELGERISERVLGPSSGAAGAKERGRPRSLGLLPSVAAAAVMLTAVAKFVTTPDAPVGWLVGGLLLSGVVLVVTHKIISGWNPQGTSP